MSAYEFHNPDNVQIGERCRVTFEGGYQVDQEWSADYAHFDTFDGRRHSVATVQRTKLTIENPERVWVQSIEPAKIRERITGEYPNPDAVALQVELDKARAEIAGLNERIAMMKEGYEASKVLWRKKHRASWWLTDARVEMIGRAIADGEPEPDPYDY